MWCTRTRRQRQLSWDKFSKSAAFRRFPTVVYNALVRELLRELRLRTVPYIGQHAREL